MQVLNNLEQHLKAVSIDLAAVTTANKADDIGAAEATVCKWLDSAARMNLIDISALTKHFEGIFSTHQAAKEAANTTETEPQKALSKMQASINQRLQAKHELFITEASVTIAEKIQHGTLATEVLASTAETLTELAKNSKTIPADLKNLSVQQQRLNLLHSINNALNTAGNEPVAFAAQLKQEIETNPHAFSKATLESLSKEIRIELELSEASQKMKSWGEINIALAGKDTIKLISTDHHLHGLADANSLGPVLDTSEKSVAEIKELSNQALGVLDSFWKQDSTRALLNDFKAKIDGNRIDDSGVTDKKQFAQALSAALINHVKDQCKDTPEVKAMIKTLATRETIQSQSKAGIMEMVKGLLNGKSLSSVLSSGIFGLLAGKMLSPMFGLVVTVISFLLNNSQELKTSEVTKPLPPKPAAA